VGATKKILIRQSEKRAQEKKLKNDKVAEELEKELKEKDLLDDDLAQKLKRDQPQSETMGFQSQYSKLWKDAKFDANDRVYHDLDSSEAYIQLSSDIVQLITSFSAGMVSVDARIVSNRISQSLDYRKRDPQNKELIYFRRRGVLGRQLVSSLGLSSGKERETSILEMYRLRAANKEGFKLFKKLEDPEVIDAFFNERFGRNDPVDSTLKERKEDEKKFWMKTIKKQLKTSFWRRLIGVKNLLKPSFWRKG